MNNTTIQRYLFKEYARPLIFPALWLSGWCVIATFHDSILGILVRVSVLPSFTNAIDIFLTATAAVAITFHAGELALRRAFRKLPVIMSVPVVKPPAAKYGPIYLRGTQIVTLTDALLRQLDILPAGDHGILWGAVCLPSHRCEHFFIFAVTRGGKSIVIRLLMQDMLCHVDNPLLGSRRRARALLYDPKPELLPCVVAIQPNAKIIITNPSDLRCKAWDLAKDFVTMTSAAQLALLLVPKNLQAHHDFYPKAVRAVLTDVFKAFILTAPGALDTARCI